MSSEGPRSSVRPRIGPKTQTFIGQSRMNRFHKSFSEDKDDQLLSKKQPCLSVTQQLSVDLLQEGFHRSFSELFSLICLDRERRAAADPKSPLRVQTPLEEQPDKLQALRKHLSRAEQAQRTASRSVVCDQRLLLGRFFSSPDDSWLALHFYHSCADHGQSRPSTEARACLAELYLQQGELQRALQEAELCVHQAADSWLDDDGRSLQRRGKRLLGRILTRTAAALLQQDKAAAALTLLPRAHSISTDIGDIEMEGEASYLLGRTYQSTGHHDRANQFFHSCAQTYHTLQDADGLGRAHLAMAQCLQRQGLFEDSVLCLEKLIEIYRSCEMQDKMADICLNLGVLYYSKGQHRNALQRFLQSYEAAADIGDAPLQQKAQVMIGCTRAHLLIGRFCEDVTLAPEVALKQLLSGIGGRGQLDDSPDC